MKKLFFFTAIAAFILVFASCSDDEPNPQEVKPEITK